MDELDKIIVEIQEQADLSAEAWNALHGAMSKHPWCTGKGLTLRKLEVRCVLAGRRVPIHLLRRMERVADG